ncbi:hypothetical protein H2201_001911 [Coniosporium apollinis]|uniref:beta-glucosidase n=1 Tax=Coniosporium apollinis TaxID=61459 RepID=A0ABQ9P0J7_9PEZI|nr:hypothetical protein H2201_001911 [Coniosporium apollinis]
MLGALLLPLLAAGLTEARDSWERANERAGRALSGLSLEQKVGIVTGVGWTKGPCVGNTSPAPSIGYPSLCLQDGPLGIRFAKGVTAFPAGIQAGSTWDINLIRERGKAMGEEARGLGIHVLLAPVAGPLGKIARGGRNWEGFAADPYLSGIAMKETIDGIQSVGVQACAKHWIGNEQELRRETISSDIKDRELHELYMWPFVDAVKADVASVMCSYNKVNGTWACDSDYVNNKLLKTELGYRGYVLSDWNAQHSTVQSANGGLDMTMPGTDFNQPPGSIYWGPNLTAAVRNGEVPEARVNDMVRRILAQWYALDQDRGYPATTINSWNLTAGGPDVQGDHKNIARTVARDGIVLLKNDNNALPLKKPSSLAIIGEDAIVNPAGPNACPDRGCNTGTLAMGWGSGTADFPYLVDPVSAISRRAAADGTTLATSTTNDQAAGASAAAAASTAMVFINADSGEGYITVEGNAGDRINLDPWHSGNELVAAVAAVGKPTIVVIHSVGPIILERILAQQNVVAIVWAGLPGQESGNALVDVLYGDVNPSGKLPYTIAKSESDYPTIVDAPNDPFSEGLYIDYRRFDAFNIAPRYEFGFGMSYTTFGFKDLDISSRSARGGNGYGNRNSSGIAAGPATGRRGPGGRQDLFDIVATVTATVTNTGRVRGAEVAQLYISLPSSAPETPPRQLRGFVKLNLRPGQSRKATFELRRRDLSFWDVSLQEWVVPRGNFGIQVGASSRDAKLTGTITV